MSNETSSKPRKPNRRDVQRKIDKDAVEVSSRQVAYAWGHSLLREIGLTLLDARYRALPIDVWEDLLRYVGTDRADHVSESRERDNHAICFAAEVSDKFDVNGTGIVIDRRDDPKAYNVLLVYDGRYTQDPRTADKALRLATIERQGDTFVIEPSAFGLDRQGVAFFA